MDLAWCPVCDKQTFAVENLYCSEACRKKDASSTLNEKWIYEFPKFSSRKRTQSPYNSPYNSPYSSPYNSPYNSLESSPQSSPKLYPNNTTTMMENNFQLPYIISSSPSDLLLYRMPTISSTRQTSIRR